MSWKSDLDEVGSGSQGIVQKIGSVASKKLASSFRSEAQQAERLTAKGFRKKQKTPLDDQGELDLQYMWSLVREVRSGAARRRPLLSESFLPLRAIPVTTDGVGE